MGLFVGFFWGFCGGLGVVPLFGVSVMTVVRNLDFCPLVLTLVRYLGLSLFVVTLVTPFEFWPRIVLSVWADLCALLVLGFLLGVIS